MCALSTEQGFNTQNNTLDWGRRELPQTLSNNSVNVVRGNSEPVQRGAGA
jgi:hypothetical protein